MSKGILKYLLLFAGLVIFLAAYFLVYMNFSDQTDKINTEIKTLNDRLAVLEGYKAELPQYQESIDKDKQTISGVLSRYYNVERPEDFIMFTTAMESDVGVSVTAMSFTEPAFILKIAGVEDNEKDTMPAKALELNAYGISSVMNSTMTYEQMKKALEFIYMQKDATTLESLNISFDASTGLLMGDMIVNKYFITGRENVDHQLSIPYNNLGKNVLMGG